MAVSVVACLVLGACGSSSALESHKAPHYPAGTVISKRLPDRVERTAFVNQDGRTVRLADLTGKTVVIQDVMTLCQELCPIDTSTFVRAARDYAASASNPDDVVFLSVTVDPQRDTPAQLAAYRRAYVGAAANLPQWQLLTGSRRDISALWRNLGVWVHRVPVPQDEKVDNWRTGRPLTYDVQHSDQAFFFDASGRERYILDGMPMLGRASVPPALQQFMSAKGRRNELKSDGWTAAQAVDVLDWLTG